MNFFLPFLNNIPVDYPLLEFPSVTVMNTIRNTPYWHGDSAQAPGQSLPQSSALN